ncbi:hypothetical protein [Achromobacter phage Motura]|uniref:Uncharacterized protein n=1 Tax=Achromobacter phage Motura TaxID=2591403 RepID=A0A514CSS2_9CAUD|nr:hypothetical protein H1O15_gp259 [Achromobacter phage Motura]QDH83529.1 hypothetical protein [Achromobacter phage Motura]
MNYKRAYEEAQAHLETLAKFGGTLQQARELAQVGLTRSEDFVVAEAAVADTPARRDPDDQFAHYVDLKRSELTLGDFTDDELANYAFMNYDRRPSIEDLLTGCGYPPIAIMTAVKERIRWLSRKLLQAQGQ